MSHGPAIAQEEQTTYKITRSEARMASLLRRNTKHHNQQSMRKVWFECAKLIEHAFRREPMELEEEEEEVYWALPTQKMIMEIDAEDYLDLPRSTRKERVAAKEYDMRKIECAYPGRARGE